MGESTKNVKILVIYWEGGQPNIYHILKIDSGFKQHLATNKLTGSMKKTHGTSSNPSFSAGMIFWFFAYLKLESRIAIEIS